MEPFGGSHFFSDKSSQIWQSPNRRPTKVCSLASSLALPVTGEPIGCTTLAPTLLVGLHRGSKRSSHRDYSERRTIVHQGAIERL